MKSKKIMISLALEPILASKRYAKNRGTSIEELFRQFIEDTVFGKLNGDVADGLMFALDEASGSSKLGNNSPAKFAGKDAYPK